MTTKERPAFTTNKQTDAETNELTNNSPKLFAMTLQLKTKRIIIKPMKNNNKSFAQQQSPKQLLVAHTEKE